MEKESERVDMLIIGAGISGINMAFRFQEAFPNHSYIVLEARDNIGGTWDLFKYPGIRSDSDLYTFGFAWRRWSEKIPIVEGGKILQYLKDAARENGIDKRIRCRSKLTDAKWSSKEQCWTLSVDQRNGDGETIVKYYKGSYMVMASGFYDYNKPLEAVIPGLQEHFKGQVAHPQFWPQDLDYKDKKVAVIGSGATAITLIPALAKTASRVTMVQRSPGYIISMRNKIATRWWERFVPEAVYYRLVRLSFIWMMAIMTRFATGGDWMKKWLRKSTEKNLPSHIPYDPHFKPRYKPWDQRVCLCPDGDFFDALKSGKAGVETGVIKTVTAKAIIMESGATVEADIIITATGLHMLYGGGATIHIDGEALKWHTKFLWRGVGLTDVPNFALIQGYTKASWTLGADATAHMVCRLFKHLLDSNLASATPRIPEQERIPSKQPGIMGLTSNWLVSAKPRLPSNGDRDPWKARSQYLWDMWVAKYGDFKGGLEFEGIGMRRTL